MEIRHTKGLQFVASERGHEIIIDQPVSGGGMDAGMTPPELFISALGSCIGVYVVDFCEKHQISTEGLKINLSFEKSTDSPKRLSKIQATVDLPVSVPDSLLQAIHRVAEQCLIHQTIIHTPEIEIDIAAK